MRGMKIGRNSPLLNHLFFADDALFFMKGIMENCWALRKILDKFCQLSGEMVNSKKSFTVFSKNTPQKFIRLLSKRLGMQKKEKLGTYLGCSMDVDGRTLNIFQKISDKVASTISSWKFKSIN